MSENNKPPVTGDGGKTVPGAPTGVPDPTINPKNAAPPPPPSGPPKPPPPKNPGMVTCTIDGKEVVVKPGTNMIEAAKSCGSDIPYYCYHPRLSIAANCRMCLVEASNSPKLVPACQTPLSEGVAVKTQTPKVKESQRSVMEFLLLNHPVDCSICDQAGECKLQDYYMKYDFKPSRLEGGKVLKNKRKVLGPLVVLDQERCILCTRCVRFMNEVPKEPQLGVFGRGSHEMIDVFPGAELTSNYSGNTVDICPVGALLNRDFRFRARAWFLSTNPSVCTGCSRGCNIYNDFFGQDTYRYRPRENEQVNKSWMCDQGRLSYKYLNAARALHPTIGRGADLREATVAEAAKEAMSKLKPLAGSAGLTVLASPLLSNEELLAGLSFAKDVLKTTTVYVGGRPDGQGDHYLMTADKNPNRKGLEWIAAGLGLTLKPCSALLDGLKAGQVKALYALGTELPVDAEGFTAAAGRLELLVAHTFNLNPLAAAAHVVLPITTHVEDEGSFVNLEGIIQRFRRSYFAKGEATPVWKWVSELGTHANAAVHYESAKDVFAKLKGLVPQLAEFGWDASAPPQHRRKGGISPMPAAADGRPPGYREFGLNAVTDPTRL